MTRNLDRRVCRLEADQPERKPALVVCADIVDADEATADYISNHPEAANRQIIVIATGVPERATA